MISLSKIEHAYKNGNTLVHSLKGINLNIEKGEIFGILGNNGADKSALIRCINLLTSPSRGSIIMDNCDLTTLTSKALREARRSIGMIFEHFNLLNTRTVFDNVALPLELAGMSANTIAATVPPLLHLTKLAHKANDYPSQFDNLQKQKLAIARALATKPKILLCEEATAALDLKSKHTLLQLLRTLNKKLNLTIVCVSHEWEVIKSICNRAAVLQNGKIVEQGTILDLYTHPQSGMTKEFIQAAARTDLPNTLKKRLQPLKQDKHSLPIIRFAFRDATAHEACLTTVMQQFKIRLNIIQAHLETIQNNKIGILIAEMQGDIEEVQKAMCYLDQQNLPVEILGYVA